MMRDKRSQIKGSVINGFRIIDIASKETGASAKYLTECTICGHRAIKSLSSIRYKKGERCAHCPPDYHFEICGDYAIGHLCDGTEFKIDKEDIPAVSKFHWYKNGAGYLFHRDSETKIPFRLHRYVLGLSTDDGLVVDHLNHDKCDNRKCNLRIGTQAENCLNNIKRCSNTIGHVGLRIENLSGDYIARIEKGGQTYDLIKSSSIEDAAQAYNVAADYLFGVGIGYRNRVLYPTQEFTCDIVEKIKIAQQATDKVSKKAV